MPSDNRLAPRGLWPLDPALTPVADGTYGLQVAGGVAEGWVTLSSGTPSGIQQITSDDNTVTITNPYGPITDLSSPGGSGGDTYPPSSITYAQNNVTTVVARTTTSGSTWPFVTWLMAHYQFWRIDSFACDVTTADTYTLSIDGEDVASAVAAGGAPIAITLTLSTPKVLTPGPHVFRLRGTASRTYYYSTTSKGAHTGTYTTGIAIGPWMEPDVVATAHGTMTFDAEGT